MPFFHFSFDIVKIEHVIFRGYINCKKAKFMGEVTATINMIPVLFMDMSFPYSSIVIWLHSNFKILMSEKYFAIH